MAKKRPAVDTAICVSCGECEYVCPRHAVHVHNGICAKVDRELCVGCGLCAKNCPAGCIRMEEVTL